MDHSNGGSYQNVVVMRHGDRMDNVEALWVSKAERPWDPPLADAGRVRAFCTGRNLKSRLDFPIHRVFVSPFLRCIQTASKVVSALCAVDNDASRTISAGVAVDPSKIKVSIEYGLAEMMSTQAIRPDVAPKDGKFDFDMAKLEAMFPAGTVDPTAIPIYEELPKWEETVAETRARYEQVFKALADKYPSENLLFVTHGAGIGVSVYGFMKDVRVYEIDYCAYAELRRKVFQKGQSFTAEDFESLTTSTLTGIVYTSSLSE